MMMYRIGDFSRLTSTPIKTLRYYDEIGLLRPARMEPSTSYRYYSAAQVEQLNRIAVFKDLGFSLREVRGLITDNVPLDQIGEMLQRRHRELQRHVASERSRLARATSRLAAMQGTGQATALAVAMRTTSTQLVASIRDTIRSYDEYECLFEELGHHVPNQGRRLQRGAIWHACPPRAIDCEVFLLLTSRFSSSTKRVRVYDLPGSQVVSFVYRGDAAFVPAYRVLRDWIGAGGVEAVGPKRELFLEEGGSGLESVTEVQLPVRAADDSLQSGHQAWS